MWCNLGDLVHAAALTHGDRVAFQVRRGFRLDRVTFRQAEAHAQRLAAWLHGCGLTRGDRVVVWSPNMPEYAVLYFGSWLAGVVVVPIDVRTPQDVVQRFVASARPRLGFKSRYLEGRFGAPVEETHALEDLFALVAGTAPRGDLAPVGRDDLAEIAFTSGTTGVPKGVMLTHGNLLAEVAALRRAFPLRPRYRALSVLPLSHAFELVVNLLLTFSSGVRMTYVPRVNAITIGRALREDAITCMAIVPEMLRLLLNGIERRVRREGQWQRWELAHRLAAPLPFVLRRLLFRQVYQALGGQLRFFGCGGAPLDLKVARAWERIGVRVFEGYGLTETSAAAAINNWQAHRLGSVGKPVPGAAVRIAPDDEILIRGPMVTLGYYDNPDLTAKAFADGWLRTGDAGRIDADGYLHVSGREAFKIVLSDGRNVYPEDVEQALNEHSLVRESCVVGVERDGGEAVHAVLLTDAPEQAGEIVRATNRRLAAHQQVMGYTIWREEDFPRTPTLKVNRKLVREVVAHEQAGRDQLPHAEPEPAADPLVGIVARVASQPASAVRNDAELGSDLDLDSIGRLELLSVIEEELGRQLDETQVGPQTTVGDLRDMIAARPTAATAAAPSRWQRSWWARLLRPLVLWLGFRLQDRWMRIEVVNPERAAQLPLPSILIFNYQGPYAPLVMLRALPPHVRSRVAIAADARLWQGHDRWQGWLIALAGQAFPFVKSGGAVRGGLEELGRWLDDGYAVILSPEGNPEVDGQLAPFLGGTGLMAVEMRVPVVPFRLEGYHRLFPRDPEFPYLPDKRGTTRVVVGEPIIFPPGMPYHEATGRAREALIQAR